MHSKFYYQINNFCYIVGFNFSFYMKNILCFFLDMALDAIDKVIVLGGTLTAIIAFKLYTLYRNKFSIAFNIQVRCFCCFKLT